MSVNMKKHAIHIIYAGVFLLFAGVQLHAVEAFRMTPQATELLSRWFGPPANTPNGAMQQFVVKSGEIRKTFTPPDWIAWACLSAGAVLTVHGGLQMRK